MNESSVIAHLKELKRNLLLDNVSVLVGAGFSKNVSSEFLSWEELLKDLVIDLFGEEIDRDYVLLKEGVKNISLDAFRTERVKFYIRKNGYLQLVSNYLRKKGYAETIATYIEERTPFVVVKGKKKYLRVYKNNEAIETELPLVKLNLHSKLLDLPWNNIFTTNYDNLLEVCIDRELDEKLLKRIQSIEAEIEAKQKDAQIKIERLLHSPMQYSGETSAEERYSNTSTTGVQSDSLMKQEIIEVSKNAEGDVGQKEQIQNLLEGVDDFVDSRSVRVNKLMDLRSQVHSIIIDSSGLALKRNKNIIKLHGDLRESSEAVFGFDGDLSKHYVISKEDYDSYPTKHEAFTQLMRISLLQQSFCLIGFSGDDPNFMAWVGWVRDIIQRKRGQEKFQIKVYLISVSSKALSADKKLFFRNHNIAYVPLRNGDCIEFLERETGKKIRETGKDIEEKGIMELFLAFLDKDTMPSKLDVAVELLEQEDYKSFWNSLPSVTQTNLNIDQLLEREFPAHLKSTNRIPSVMMTDKLRHLLFISSLYFNRLKNEHKSGLSKLLARAAEDLFLPISAHRSLKKSLWELFEDVKDDLTDFYPIAILKVKDCVWRNDREHFEEIRKEKFDATQKISPEFENEFTYQKALLACINLDFSRVKEILKNWNPNENWVIKKAGLLALFDIDEANKFLENVSLTSLQEQLYKFQLQRLILLWSDFSVAEKLSAKIQSFKKEGLKAIEENLDYLIERVAGSKLKVEPYGVNTYSFGEYSFTNESEELQSLQFFGIIMESGFPLSIPNVGLYNSNKVYTLIQHSLEAYPFPILYYTLQFGNEKFLRRVGQDYAYNDRLAPVLTKISGNLTAAFFSSDTPPAFKESIINFYSGIMIALDPNLWNNFVNTVWNDLLSSGKLFSNRYFSYQYFILQGIKYLSQPAYLAKIIADCLNYSISNKGTSDEAILYLYYISSNKMLSEKRDEILSNPDLLSALEKTISSISSEKYSGIFALGNINELLTSSDKAKIKENLYAIDLNKIQNSRIWHILLFFTDNDQILVDRIKCAIVNNSKLWNSNISKGKASSLIEFIPIQRLRKSHSRPNGIIWNSEHARAIYVRLKIELSKISSFLKKQPDLLRYDTMLLEMREFLIDESENLKNENDYATTLFEVQKLYSFHSGFNSVLDGIESNNKTAVVLALQELSREIYFRGRVNEKLSLMEALLNKLLYQAEPALSACLEYLTTWIYDSLKERSLKVLANNILRVIKKYNSTPPKEMDLPFIEQNLVKLALVLNEWGIDDPIIPDYMIKVMQSRFNNVRYALFARN